MKQTISILGCGWLGIPLAESLIQQCYKVKGSTRSHEKLSLLKSKGITPYQIDLEQLNDSITSFLDADVLIIATTCKNPEAFKTLIPVIEKSRIRQVIFISSTSVYPLLNRVVTESDTTNESVLVSIEQLFILNSLPTTILRFSGLIGPKRNPARFFRNGKTVKHPQGYVNLIHLSDCVACIYGFIKKNITNDIFNVCSDEHPKRIDFYTELAHRFDYPIPEFQNPNTVEYKIISNQKLKDTLAYTFIYSNPLTIPKEAYD